MMWGYGQGGGWWLWGVLLLLGIVLLVVLAVWTLVGGVRGGARGGQWHGRPPASTARRILDERFARGELTAEQYREQLRVLGEGP